ncbi:MAG TPA: hypothetical protein VJY33_14685, partial [Isosphaeraceae bacterium]|nr:hypothetical protein [Isosphaeraceae bacterium]
APLRGAHVLLCPAGGPPTIDFPDIPPLIEAIGPRLVVPMHFKTPFINLNIQPLEKLLEVMPKGPVVHTHTSSMNVTRESLPSERTIVVLDHAR